MILLAGCIKNREKKEEHFFGEWDTDMGYKILFNSDGTCEFNGMSGSWELSGKFIYINVTYKDGKNMMFYEYNFLENYTILELVDTIQRKITCYRT